MTVRWWTSRTHPRHAGIRIRAHLVMRELRRQGCDAGWFDPDAPQADSMRTLVLHMRYDEETFRRARSLREHGVRVVADLCDNHFYGQGDAPQNADRAQALRRMLELADDVTVSTPELGAVVRANATLRQAPHVIPDACDDLGVVPVGLKQRLRTLWPTARLRRDIGASIAAGRVPLIWFGHHGKYEDVGMLDLLRLRPDLEGLDRRVPLHLTVVSDNRDKFVANFGDWSFPVVYGDWQAHTFGRIARMHRIALIPVVENDFTRGKSANRVVTAFAHGLAVVADPLPSYRPFVECMSIAAWSDSIERYAKDDAARERDVARGLEVARTRFGIEAVAQQWRAVLGL